MRRWLLGPLVALATVAFSATAVAAEPANPHQAAQNAEIEMLKCFFAQAASLDDHVSDASTIAQGVVSACHPKINDWKYAYSAEYLPLAATQFRDRLEQMAHGYAVETVLKVRAAARH